MLFKDYPIRKIAEMDKPYRCPVVYQVGLPPKHSTRLAKGVLCIDTQGLHLDGTIQMDMPFDAIRRLNYQRIAYRNFIRIQSRCTLYIMAVNLHLGLQGLSNPHHMEQIYSRLHRQIGGRGRCGECGYNMLMSQGNCPDCGSVRVFPGIPLR